MDEANAALFADEVNRTFNGRSRANSVSTKGGGDINREQNNKQRGEGEEVEEEEEEDDASVSSGNSVEGEKGSEVDTTEAIDASQPGGPPLPPVSELHGGESVSAGAVMTHQGLVPIEFAADFELTDTVLVDGEESDTQGDQARSRGTRSERIAAPATAHDTRAKSRASPRGTPVTQRAVGRPRRDSQPMTSAASPDGPTLVRNPERAASDAAESEKNKRLYISSDRLGGRDLRVLRDNFEAMGGRDPRAKAKSPASESSVTTTYAASKRNQAKQRMDSIDKELKKAEAFHASTGSDMKELLLIFREDADRRAEAEEKRRREERDVRRAEEKREREEREKVRRDEAALVEARRHQDQEDAKRHVEAAEKKEEAARADRREEEAERRRQFQARLEQDRAEARQRHDQMLLLISTIHKSK